MNPGAQELFVKICGITNAEDARVAAKAGANALGFVCSKADERYVTPEQVVAICSKLPGHVSRIGVFTNANLRQVLDVARSARLSAVQLSGPEGPDDLYGFELSVIKVLRLKPGFDPESMRNFLVEAFLVDPYQEGAVAGSGRSFGWNLAAKARHYGRVILSGGLTPENVEAAVKVVRPYGVDVNEGVEVHPGKKDPDKVRAFIANARNAMLAVDIA